MHHNDIVHGQGRMPGVLVVALVAIGMLLGASAVMASTSRAWARQGPDHDLQQRSGDPRPPMLRIADRSRRGRYDSRFRFIYTYHGAPVRYHSRPVPRYWHRGHWFHGWYGPYFGWWWIVGADWYLYPGPVYPYPTVVVEPAPSEDIVNAPSAPPPPQYWYYCPGSHRYYPYVSECPGGWERVPTIPSGTPSGSTAPPAQARP